MYNNRTLKLTLALGKFKLSNSFGDMSSARNRGTISFPFGAPLPTKRHARIMFLRDIHKIGGRSEHCNQTGHNSFL